MNNLEASKVLEKVLKVHKEFRAGHREEIQALSHVLFLLKTECKLVPETKELMKTIQNDVVGKAAIENWFPKGRSLQQFDEIAYNRFYRLSETIHNQVLQNWIGIKGGLREIAKIIYHECFDFSEPQHHGDCTNEPQSCMWCLCLNAADKLTDFIEKGK